MGEGWNGGNGGEDSKWYKVGLGVLAIVCVLALLYGLSQME